MVGRKVFGDEEGCISILEVAMYHSSVFVRDLLLEEGNRLSGFSREAASEAKRERALICWASATKMSAPQVAALIGTDETHVRNVIQAFNERGSARWILSSGGGRRPRRIIAGQRARIVPVAGAVRHTWGVPAARWSLRRLARYLREQQIVQVSPAHLGRILAQAGLSFQRTRTWLTLALPSGGSGGLCSSARLPSTPARYGDGWPPLTR